MAAAPFKLTYHPSSLALIEEVRRERFAARKQRIRQRALLYFQRERQRIEHERGR